MSRADPDDDNPFNLAVSPRCIGPVRLPGLSLSPLRGWACGGGLVLGFRCAAPQALCCRRYRASEHARTK